MPTRLAWWVLVLVLATFTFAPVTAHAQDEGPQFGQAAGADDPDKERDIAGEEAFLLAIFVAIAGSVLILLARARNAPPQSHAATGDETATPPTATPPAAPSSSTS